MSSSQRARQIVERVLMLPTHSREAEIDGACAGDEPLKREVLELLALKLEIAGVQDSGELYGKSSQRNQVTSAIEGQRATAAHYMDSVEGAVIAGKYELIQKLGEGGMGTVWAAKQSVPVKRLVALKVVKTGMDTSAVLARFEQERQALALMDHPHIARVLDGGATETGQPFFVMELVKGQTLTKFCDSEKLSPRQRLELFMPICQAVQHAHQKGIIHRDLKPANILVSMIDGKPVPKIIDFGVAKATNSELADSLESTQLGAVIGTLEYMSPEQAGYSTEGIDTRSDIYSLGVILYELLTGLRPIDAARLKKAALAEVIRVIQEEAPSRPSARLATNESIPSLAAVRRTEPKKLVGLLRGELDWIVMKCLEKSRDRRYETANGLERDVQRFLSDEPVEARPPSISYRTGKFIQRNRGAVTAACLLLIALIGGFVGTTWGMFHAEYQRGIAQRALEGEQKALANEVLQREAAEAANKQAYIALKSFTDDLMEKVLGSRTKLDDNDRSILLNAQKQWEVFANSKGESEEARAIRAEGAETIGLMQEKLGMLEEAESNLRHAATLRSALVDAFPESAEHRRQLARYRHNLGAFFRGTGKTLPAEEQFKMAVELLQKLVSEFPKEDLHRRKLAKSLSSLANSARDQGRWEESLGHLDAALKLQNDLAAKFPARSDYAWEAAGTHWTLAFVNKRLRNYGVAEGHYREALSVGRRVAKSYPEVIEYRSGVAGLHRELGVMLYDNGDDAGGAAELPKAIEIQKALADEYPSTPIYRANLGSSYRDYAKVLGYLNKTEEAAAQFGNAEVIFQRLVAEQPAAIPYLADLGLCYLFRGEWLLGGEEPLKSKEWFEKAVQTLNAAHLRFPQKVLTRNALAKALAGRASTHRMAGDFPASLEDWNRAVELAPEDRLPDFRLQRADTQLRAGDVSKALSEAVKLAELDEWSPGQWYLLARIHAAALKTPAEGAEKLADRAMELLTKAVLGHARDVSSIASDEALSALREREDFKKLLASLPSQLAPPAGL